MKNLVHFLKLSWKASPSYILLIFFNSVAATAKMLLNIYLFKLLVDELTNTKDVQSLILLGSLLVINNVGLTLITNLMNRFIEGKGVYFSDLMMGQLSNKIMNLEYSYLEDPHYLDLKESAVFAIHNQNAIQNMIDCFAQVLTQLFTIIGLITILIQLGWVMLVAFFVSLVLSLASVGYMAGSIVKVQKMIIPVNRKMGYYMGLMNEKQYQKDIRLYDMSKLITTRAVGFSSEAMDEFEHIYKIQGNSFGGLELASYGIAAFTYAFVGIRTVSEKFGPKLGLGSLTMYVSSVINLSSACTALGNAITDLFTNASFLAPFFEFMSLSEETMETDKEIFKGPVETVEFRDVTFTYPKAEKAVLRNLSFEIHRGEKISIVGLNGAGKSTLVKLICRMYKADSGEILVNGKNIYDYDYMSYMKEISAVFQDYKLFNFTIEENVSCMPEGGNVEEVNRLIKEVGLSEKIAELPKGIKSQFGKEYDEEGIEFSGGQGQKVAIARALYKEASMVILDEPASALDPIAEAEIYEKFNGLVADKTALYISHRMSSSVFCDKILIIDGGAVTDFDSHENLMKKTDSLYYKLFMAQAQNYAC